MNHERLGRILAPMAAVVLLDLVSKFLVLSGRIRAGDYFGDWLVIGWHENRGLMFGLGAGLTAIYRGWLTIALPFVVFVVLFVWLVRARQLSATESFGWGLFLGGGLANILDRMLHNGAVLDWLKLNFAGLSSGNFNLADLMNLIGILLVLFGNIRAQRTAPGR